MREDVKFECSDCAIVAKTAIDILKKQKGTKVREAVKKDMSPIREERSTPLPQKNLYRQLSPCPSTGS